MSPGASTSTRCGWPAPCRWWCRAPKPQDVDALLDLADGVLLTGSPSNVHPAHFGQAVHDPSLPLDPERDDWTLAAGAAHPGARHPAAGDLPRRAGSQRGARRHLAPGGAGGRIPTTTTGPTTTQPAAVQYGPAHPVQAVGWRRAWRRSSAAIASTSTPSTDRPWTGWPTGCAPRRMHRTDWSRPSRCHRPRASICACSGIRSGWRPPTRCRCKLFEAFGAAVRAYRDRARATIAIELNLDRTCPFISPTEAP